MFQSTHLRKLASQQHNIFTEIPPERGVIFDRKLTPLAVNSIAYSAFATQEATYEGLVARKLDTLLGLSRALLKEKLKLGKNFIWLKRKIPPETSLKIKELRIPGIDLIKENRRFYPEGHLACHLLGFTDIDNKGLEGLELYCDAYLAGIKGWRMAQRDAKRREMVCWGYKTILPTDGYNIILTIDSVIQSITERHLRKAAEKYKVDSATAIVIEPKSGEILALYNYPDYDINNAGEYDASVRRNVAITDMFEPGSSFKFVTAAAALEEKKVAPTDVFDCENGEYAFGRRVLHDYHPYGNLTFKQVIENSSNIGVAKIALILGKDMLYKYIRAFGFGSPTGIDLSGEVAGYIRPVAQWSKISITSLPMGQEVNVTALQLVCAMAAVANDGVLMKPKIIRFVQDKDGEVIKSFPAEQARRIVSTETADTLTEMLIGVVETGTGKKAQVAGYKTAGKTGTAQKARPEGGYYERKYVSTFVGFVPADEPMIAILVTLNDPHPQYFGGTVCAPVFEKIATETIRYLNIAKNIEQLQAEQTPLGEEEEEGNETQGFN
ncbi:MAG: penicillin-binding protein 2 [Candidatus Omnitrophota bacterium]